MRTKKNFSALLATLIATFIIGGFATTEVKAQNSVPLFIYKVEVQKHFLHWTSGGSSIYWQTLMETSDYEEASAYYNTLREDFENDEIDYLESAGVTTLTTVVDVRLRSVFNPNYLARPSFYRPSYNFQLRR
jgi:hypothetical protein